MLFLSVKLGMFFCVVTITISSPVAKYQKNNFNDVEKTLKLTLDFINIVRGNKSIIGEGGNESNYDNVYDEITNESIYESNNLPPTTFRPSNCAEIQLRGFRKSGVYQVFPKGRHELPPFEVYCDLHTQGGGWTVFQRRDDFGEPRENFFRNWTDYKQGFGNLTKDFWLGNDVISLLTIQDKMNLRVEIETFEGETASALYTDFMVEGEQNSYTMTFRAYSGTAGDSLKFHSGKTFATLDRDTTHGDVKKYFGGWWYLNGHHSNLNGLYQKDGGVANVQCVTWYHFKTKHFCLKRSELKLRPQYFVEKEFVSENGSCT